MNPYAAVKWIWIVYLGVCVLASFVQKRSIRQQSAGSSLLQMGIVLVVLAPFFVVGRRFGILSRHFVPSLPAIQYLGILLTLVPHVI